MNLQEFFQSTSGQIVLILIILALFASIILSNKNKKLTAKEISVSSLLVALSTVLSYIVLFNAPYGGSVTLVSMLPIILAGYFFNIRIGLIVGISVGLLNLLLNPYIVHPVQLLLDYPLAFGALSLGSIFRESGKYSIFACVWVGILGRFFCSFLSGVIFFASYTPEGWNTLLYSGVYNASYMVAEGAIITIVLLVPSLRTSLEKIKNAC